MFTFTFYFVEAGVCVGWGQMSGHGLLCHSRLGYPMALEVFCMCQVDRCSMDLSLVALDLEKAFDRVPQT